MRSVRASRTTLSSSAIKTRMSANCHHLRQAGRRLVTVFGGGYPGRNLGPMPGLAAYSPPAAGDLRPLAHGSKAEMPRKGLRCRRLETGAVVRHSHRHSRVAGLQGDGNGGRMGMLAHIDQRLLENPEQEYPHLRRGLHGKFRVELPADAGLGFELFQMPPERSGEAMTVEVRWDELEEHVPQPLDGQGDGLLQPPSGIHLV